MSNSIIVYFTHRGENPVNFEVKYLEKGNVEIMAECLEKLIGCEKFEIEPTTPYSKDNVECHDRARAESEGIIVPEVKEFKDLSAYDKVYVGFPIWYKSFPRIISVFLRKASLKEGTAVYPFCSNDEGSFGTAELELRSLLKKFGCELKPGVSVGAGNIANAEKILTEWVNK